MRLNWDNWREGERKLKEIKRKKIKVEKVDESTISIYKYLLYMWIEYLNK